MENEKEILNIITYGLFFDYLTLAVDDCVKKRKKIQIDKLKEFLNEYSKSLSEDEKTQLSIELNRMLEKKMDKYINTLRDEHGEEAVERVMAMLSEQIRNIDFESQLTV